MRITFKRGNSATVQSVAKPQALSKWVVLFVATVGSFLTAFTVSSVTIALPAIGADFGMDAILLSWVVTIYPLTAAAFLVPFGRLSDIFGRRRLYAIGMIIYVTGTTLVIFSPTPTALLLFRFIQGTGASMLFTTNVSMLTSAFGAGERGKALGINTAVVYLGTSVGPFIGGLLTQNFGWRSIFVLTLAMGFSSIILIFTKLKVEWAEAKGQKFDLPGSVIYSFSLVATIYGLSELPSTIGIWTTALGLAGAVIFFNYERRASSPILDLSLFRKNRVFLFSNVAALCNFAATFAVTFLMSLYLQYTKGLQPQDAGLIILCMPVTQALFSPLAGRYSDKFDPRIIASTGMGLTTIALVFMSLMNEGTATGVIIIGLVMQGIGFAMFASPNTNAVMGAVEKSQYGVAAAMLSTSRQVGFTLSMSIATLVMSIYIGKVEITPEYYPAVLASAKTSFAIFAVLCFAGIFASMARGKTLKRSAAPQH